MKQRVDEPVDVEKVDEMIKSCKPETITLVKSLISALAHSGKVVEFGGITPTSSISIYVPKATIYIDEDLWESRIITQAVAVSLDLKENDTEEVNVKLVIDKLSSLIL